MEAILRFMITALIIISLIRLISRLKDRRQTEQSSREMGIDDFGDKPSSKQSDKHPHIDPNIGEYTEYEEIEQH